MRNKLNVEINKLTLNSSQRRKVCLFAEAARTWRSGYSLGDIVEVVIVDNNGKSNIMLRDNREHYKTQKYQERHGSLTLIVDRTELRTKYSVAEKSKNGKSTFSWYCNVQRKSEIKRKQLNGKNFDYFFHTFQETLKFKSNEHEGIHFYHYEDVTIDDYWQYTDVIFDIVDKCDKNGKEREIRNMWADLRNDPSFEYHHSPCENSISAYLVNRDSGVIYRFSDHWNFGIRNCNWLLKGYCIGFPYLAIGVANIKSFKRNQHSDSIEVYGEDELVTMAAQITEDINSIKSVKQDYTCDPIASARLDNEIMKLQNQWHNIISSQKKWRSFDESYWETIRRFKGF